MLGDCNMVEMEIDRSPIHADPQRTVDAMAELRNQLNLADGWRLENPTGKQFTFSTKKRNQANSWSRIDRIYVNYEILDKCREWRTAEPGFETDHRAAIAQISPKGTPWVGSGRSTAPDFIVKYQKPARELMKLLRNFSEELKPMVEREKQGERDPQDNIQTRWKRLKESILCTAQDEARKRVSKADKNLAEWEKRRNSILNQEELDDEARIRLQEIDDEIRLWKSKKVLRV
jgi:hypothetical protein